MFQRTPTKDQKVIVTLGLLALLLGAATHVHAQTGSVNWGFHGSAEAVKQAAAVKARATALKSTMVPLTPAPDTDVTLRNATLALGPGSRAVQMQGVSDQTPSAFFWAVDTVTRTYRIFRSTNAATDAARMEQFLRQAGVPVSPALVQRLLADGAKLTARAEHRAKRKARPGPQLFLAAQGCGGNEYDDFFCTGAIDVGIATYDPAFIQLTDTYTWSDWTRSSGSWNPEMGGSCWANPDTGFSHWYISSCAGYPTVGWYYLDAETDANYYNYDFGDPDLGTFVFEQAAVNFRNGDRTWSTFHYDEGEYSWAIYGWTTLYDSHEDCWPTEEDIVQ